MSLTHTPTTHTRSPQSIRHTYQPPMFPNQHTASPARGWSSMVHSYNFPVSLAYENLKNLERQVQSLTEQNRKMSDQLHEAPAKILELLEEYYELPCDRGLSEAMNKLGLEMPDQEREVTIRWSEVVSYEATLEVTCEWNGDSYEPTDVALDSLREYAHENAYHEDTGDGEDITVV